MKPSVACHGPAHAKKCHFKVVCIPIPRAWFLLLGSERRGGFGVFLQPHKIDSHSSLQTAKWKHYIFGYYQTRYQVFGRNTDKPGAFFSLTCFASLAVLMNSIRGQTPVQVQRHKLM